MNELPAVARTRFPVDGVRTLMDHESGLAALVVELQTQPQLPALRQTVTPPGLLADQALVLDELEDGGVGG